MSRERGLEWLIARHSTYKQPYRRHVGTHYLISGEAVVELERRCLGGLRYAPRGLTTNCQRGQQLERASQ